MNEDFKFICEDYRTKAKQLIEKRRDLSQLKKDSSEYRIQSEVFNNINEEVKRYSEIIYTAILSYNNSPDTFTIFTKNDILNLQLVQDEVASILKENGIFLNYIHPNDSKNDSQW